MSMIAVMLSSRLATITLHFLIALGIFPPWRDASPQGDLSVSFVKKLWHSYLYGGCEEVKCLFGAANFSLSYWP
jgi:hypothetical protein